MPSLPPPMDNSLYHQHIGTTTHSHRVRPVVIGAPYVLCAFAVGVILLAVGTFITSHAYEDKNRDPVLLGVGPGLLGLGGLLLLSSVLICIVACLRNRRLQEALSDDFFTIGASTFDGDNQFVHLDDESHLDNHSPGCHPHRSTSGGATDSNEAIMILANTVAEERHRQRKNSRKYSRNRSHEGAPQICYTGPQGLPHNRYERENPDYLGLEPIRRTELYPELADDFGLSESDDSHYIPRSRSYSMSVRRSGTRVAPVEQRLRRNLTYTQASRARLQQQYIQQAGQHTQGLEMQQPGPQRKRSSKKRKPQATINKVVEGPTVHHLPKYDPDLLRALGLGSPRPQLNRGMSENELLAPGSAQPVSWQEDPDVTHGSLGNPRRRPSVAMGVRSIRPKHSGTAYRHSSSIYASDMELHRTDATVTSDASQGYDVRNFQSHGNSDQYHSQSGKLPSIGSSMANHSLGSSPTLIPPYDYEDTSPQPDNRRENTPSSTPSQRRMGRPLSNISSASESCCSGCCERHQEGEGGETSEHEHRPRPNPNSEGEADQSTDQRPQNSVA